MTKEEFLNKYQRTDKNNPRGTNEKAVEVFLNMLEKQSKSSDENVRKIAGSIDAIGEVAPNFVIFEAQAGGNSFFMHNFKAFQIAPDCGYDVASHEFGHAILSMATDTKVPADFENVILRAKQHALSPENKEKFKAYVEFLSKGGAERTQAEKGPVSDIISSIFQQPGFRVGSFENVCMLPVFHQRSYYFDEEKDCMKIKPIFDEDFANIFALKATEATKELETLRELFGDEFMQVMESQVELVADFFEKQSTKDKTVGNIESSLNSKIMNAITGQKKSDIENVREPEIKENRKGIEVEYRGEE